jgi:hypothetical protein
MKEFAFFKFIAIRFSTLAFIAWFTGTIQHYDKKQVFFHELFAESYGSNYWKGLKQFKIV